VIVALLTAAVCVSTLSSHGHDLFSWFAQRTSCSQSCSTTSCINKKYLKFYLIDKIAIMNCIILYDLLSFYLIFLFILS
jgi:hypothetical protein